MLRRDMPSSGSIGMGCVACVIGAAKRLARDATWLGLGARLGLGLGVRVRG